MTRSVSGVESLGLGIAAEVSYGTGLDGSTIYGVTVAGVDANGMTYAGHHHTEADDDTDDNGIPRTVYSRVFQGPTARVDAYAYVRALKSRGVQTSDLVHRGTRAKGWPG